MSGALCEINREACQVPGPEPPTSGLHPCRVSPGSRWLGGPGKCHPSPGTGAVPRRAPTSQARAGRELPAPIFHGTGRKQGGTRGGAGYRGLRGCLGGGSCEQTRAGGAGTGGPLAGGLTEARGPDAGGWEEATRSHHLLVWSQRSKAGTVCFYDPIIWFWKAEGRMSRGQQDSPTRLSHLQGEQARARRRGGRAGRHRRWARVLWHPRV